MQAAHNIEMTSVTTVYLSLGSNVGDREAHLELALEGMEEAGISILRRSSIYETAPQDVVDQPWFLNLVVQAETAGLPLRLLSTLQRIERGLGRNRSTAVPRGPRTIDIDLLLFGNAIIEASELMVPHPRMAARRFVLEPLVEIAPGLRHPATRKLFSTYLKLLQDQAIRKAAMPSLPAP